MKQLCLSILSAMCAIALAASFAVAGQPPKGPESAKADAKRMEKEADQALGRIRKDKSKSAALDAAIKAKDSAKVRQILMENGIEVGPVMTQSGDNCFPWKGRQLCITYGGHHIYTKD
jgi:hypothetical protein